MDHCICSVFVGVLVECIFICGSFDAIELETTYFVAFSRAYFCRVNSVSCSFCPRCGISASGAVYRCQHYKFPAKNAFFLSWLIGSNTVLSGGKSNNNCIQGAGWGRWSGGGDTREGSVLGTSRGGGGRSRRQFDYLINKPWCD